jgi:hypothetical protein
VNITNLWDLIDKTREAAEGDSKKQADLLTEELVNLPADEIILFQEIFNGLKDRAYIGSLWDAATVIKNGCGDDDFQEFREWLVGRGKEVYENAIKDPETLADALETRDSIFPTLLAPAMDAYEKITGKDMPPSPREWARLQGQTTINLDTEESELIAEISTRFPKLTAKFWEWWRRDKIYLEIRELLGEILAPSGFLETEIKSLAVVKFSRNQFTVEIMHDSLGYVFCISLFFSSPQSDKGDPVHKHIMDISYLEYNESTKKTVSASLQEWLVTTGL